MSCSNRPTSCCYPPHCAKVIRHVRCYDLHGPSMFWYIKHVNASNNNITTRRYGEAGTVCLNGLSEMLFYMIAWWSEYMGFL